MYDVIIIGNGPAGVSASLYIQRANLSSAIIGKDYGSLAKAEKIQNYYGLDSISGTDLVLKGIEQARNLGTQIIVEEVINIEYMDKFIVTTKFNTYYSKIVILATGISRKAPIIQGINKFEGRGISYCAVCDAFFYKNKDVAVLGEGEYALNEAMELLPVVNSVTVLTNGKETIETRTDKIKINTKEIENFDGDELLKKVIFKDNTNLPISGVFIASGMASSTDFARKLGANINRR